MIRTNHPHGSYFRTTKGFDLHMSTRINFSQSTIMKLRLHKMSPFLSLFLSIPPPSFTLSLFPSISLPLHSLHLYPPLSHPLPLFYHHPFLPSSVHFYVPFCLLPSLSRSFSVCLPLWLSSFPCPLSLPHLLITSISHFSHCSLQRGAGIARESHSRAVCLTHFRIVQ